MELQRNFGQTAAMQAGIDTATGRLIATLDGDLQNDPRDIPAMVAAIEERELDLLVGWRKNRQDGPFPAQDPSWCANYLIGKITGVKLHDYGCSLKIYRASIIKQVKLMGEMHRFIPAWVAGVVPSSADRRNAGHPSRAPARQRRNTAFRAPSASSSICSRCCSSCATRRGRGISSVRSAWRLGALSALILFYLFFDKFLLGNDIGTRPMLIVGVMLFLSSVQLITTGILAEMMARTYSRENDTPAYIVRKVFSEDAPNT